MKRQAKLTHLILAEGEATGHKHEVIGEQAVLYQTDEANVLLLDAPQGGVIQHAEHAAQPVQFHGLNERVIVREYDHFAEEARNIAD